ncbi:MAG: heptosyltransferase-2 [Halioglobus sp.]|jgi:heptosyltransferase-2
MSDAPEKILVVGPAWVGDMVMSQSLYIFLKNSRPGVTIDVLAPAWSEPLLERMPEVSRAIVKPIGHGELGLGRRRKLGRVLRENRYDQAILLPNSFKSALAPFMARIPKRTGWRGEMRYGLLNDMRALDESRLPLMVERFVALGQDANQSLPLKLPAPHLAVENDRVARCAQKFGFDRKRPILALCPGAEFGSAKRWPAEYYAQVATHYLSMGWQVVLFGSAKDREVTAEIRKGCNNNPECFDLAGNTELAEAVDLLSLATAVLSNDSGLMHIASALRRPVLVVYGATSPAFTPPLSEQSDTVIPTIDCAPCFARECPLGHHRCMRETGAEMVIAKLDALLLQGRSV